MSQAGVAPGRPWQDGLTRRSATPASTQKIPAIGLKKDIGAILHPWHHASGKPPTSVKVCLQPRSGLYPCPAQPSKPCACASPFGLPLMPARLCYRNQMRDRWRSTRQQDPCKASRSRCVTICRHLSFLSHRSRSLENYLIALQTA